MGFEWDHQEQVWDKVKEEMAELQEAVAEKGQDEIEEEFGDLLFSWSIMHGFADRCRECAGAHQPEVHQPLYPYGTIGCTDGQSLADLSLAEMDALWNTIKKQNPGT